MFEILSFDPVPGCNYRTNYIKVCNGLNRLASLNDIEGMVASLRKYCLTDLFFLLYFVLDVKPINHPWLVDRANEVQDDHDRTLDLWSREHFKSTFLTYGLVIQEILNNPEERIAIFSHTRGIAKAFLHRIKVTFETNDLLKTIFPDVLYNNPSGQSPRWSLDEGIIVRRKGVYLEATVEAWGLVDGMPTSRHYTIRVYDDIVTRESVTTPEQIKKVDDCFKLSQFLKARGGSVRVVGTRYHFADQYEKMKASGGWKVRERVGVVNNTPVLMTPAELDEFKKIVCDGNMYVYNCQMLLNPVAEEAQEFKRSWIRYYRRLPDTALNLYLFVDPSSGRKEKQSGSDYSVFWLWGLDPLGNYFLVDVIREKLNLLGRWKALKGMMIRHPRILKVYYEQYGMQADVEYHFEKMKIEGFYFTIDELGGKLTKEDRIRKLIPLFEEGKVYLPEVYVSDSGRDLIKEFIEEEYCLFPFAPHDDMLDAASRIRDEKCEAFHPQEFPYDEGGDEWEDGSGNRSGGNVLNLGDWARRKENSRYANV